MRCLVIGNGFFECEGLVEEENGLVIGNVFFECEGLMQATNALVF